MEEAALGNLTKDRGLVMRGQGWPLGEEDNKRRRGSNQVCGEKRGSVSRENRCTAFVVGWTVLFLHRWSCLVLGRNLTLPCLRLQPWGVYAKQGYGLCLGRVFWLLSGDSSQAVSLSPSWDGGGRHMPSFVFWQTLGFN